MRGDGLDLLTRSAVMCLYLSNLPAATLRRWGALLIKGFACSSGPLDEWIHPPVNTVAFHFRASTAAASDFEASVAGNRTYRRSLD